MSGESLLERMLAGFLESLQPVREAIATPSSLSAFLREFGWDLSPADTGGVGNSLASLASLPTDPSSLDLQHLSAAVGDIVHSIRSIADSGASSAFVSTFPRELLDCLVYVALARNGATAFSVLHFVGVLSERRVEAAADTGRGAYLAREVHWDRLLGVATQPLATVTQSYGWGAQFDGDGFLRSLGMLIRGLGGRANLHATDGAVIDQYFSRTAPGASSTVSLIIAPPESGAVLTTGARQNDAGIVLMVLPIPPQADVPGPVDGIALIPVVTGQASDVVHFSDEVSLAVAGDFVARPVRAEIHPGRSVIRAAQGDVHIDASARLDAKAPSGAPWILFGDADSNRLEIAASHATVTFSSQGDGDAELRVEVGIDAAALVVDFSRSDGFLSGAVASSPTRTALAVTLMWSSRSGFSLGNLPKLQLSLPLHQSIGSVAQLQSVDVSLGAGPGKSIALEATVSGSVAIGPVKVSLAQVGMRLLLDPRSDAQPPGNLGNLDFGFGFKFPSGIGIVIDASVVTGGGFIYHDPVRQMYAGAMQLTLHERITLKAFGLLATLMPDGSRGYSLIVFITAEGFQPIQLGMGFTLNGIGGMVAIHRTFDEDVLRAGLKNDTLGTLLFPRDPAGNAPALITALAAAFPAKQGSYLLGLLVRIGWFTPPLVLLDLALILEFGARTRLLVLGRISALLPSPDNDLVRLILDSMGVIDFDQGTVSIDAVLVDSRLAHKFALTGAMALRARWSSGPGSGFILAVGGLNPHFAPPEGLPVLQRVGIALSSGDNPRLSCDAYFAITSNTVQFGAHAQLYAAAYGFSVEGDIGFDVLIQIAPLHFIADFDAKVQLKHGSSNLFMVSVDGELEGPRPLRVSGKASFSIFWCDFTVRFDKTLVDGEAPPLPPAIDVLAQLKAALAQPQNWTAQRAPGHTQGVALRALPPSSPQLVLDPLGRLLVKQQVVPLNTGRDIEDRKSTRLNSSHG